MPDNEVYDLFARINTYSEKLKAQELRNAKWFGDFKSCVYLLSKEFSTFFAENEIFTAKSILRMAEAEYISDLLLAMQEGITAGDKRNIDDAYKDYDEEFPGRKLHEKRFRATIDAISAIYGDGLGQSEFSAIRLLYPLFCAVYHFKFGLEKFKAPRTSLKLQDYPKAKTVLENIGLLITNIKDAEKNHEEINLSTEDRKFYDALTVHWVHADKRVVMAEYICKKLKKALTE